MGCGASKVDDLPLVTLCRERKNFIKAASHHRCALAAAHLSYFHSLTDVGDAIRAFVDDSLLVGSPPPSPVLTLPSREGKSKSSSSSLSAHSTDTHHFHKDDEEELQDSHLSSHSDSDSDSDSNPDPHSGHIHIHDSPRHEQVRQGMTYSTASPPHFGNYDPQEMYNPNPSYSYQYPYPNPAAYENSNSFPPYQNANPFPPYDDSNQFPPYQNANPFPPYQNSNPFPSAYYMKKSATTAKTVVYEDPSASGYVGSAYYGNGGYYSMMGGPPHEEPSPKKPPPVPPSPPRVSAWDYLNVFGAYDQESAGDANSGYYPASMRYGVGSSTSSPDSKELREREGIPDLEDETEQEMNVKKKNINANSNYGGGLPKPPHVSSNSSISISEESTIESVKGKGIKSSISPDAFHSPDSIVFKSPDVENETVMRKKGVSFEVEIDGSNHVTGTDVDSSSKLSSATTLSAHATRDLQEVVKEIKDEFETATSYGKEVALMLEVGKLPYQYPRRTTLFKVISSRIVHLLSSHPPPVTPPLQISSRTLKLAKTYPVELGDDFEMKCKNLSSTLEELYAWEKKLYKEVKDEESLRIVYEKKCKRLKTLDDNGAESSKIDATQASIRKLLTQINVCIRAVDAISRKIHRLRDEELQPQISELIHGLIRMWKSMVRCHQRQFQAIMESKVRTLKANTSLQRDSSLKATVELEMELVNWCSRFNRWIHAQKAYVGSLNEWLLRSLNREPEETPDGIAPFSPGRIGAPPIFVICNDWCQAMVNISEKGVENAMLNFASSLHQLWERQGAEQHQRTKADHLKKDFEKKMRTLQMERGRIEREHDASSEKTMSKVPSESGVSPLDDLKVDMDSMREKLEVERARHKEAAKLVHDAASSSVQGGLVPIFEALGNFTAEVLKAHEEVRLQNVSGS